MKKKLCTVNEQRETRNSCCAKRPKKKNNAKLIEFSTNGISEMVIEVYYHLPIITVFFRIIVIKWHEEKLHIKWVTIYWMLDKLSAGSWSAYRRYECFMQWAMAKMPCNMPNERTNLRNTSHNRCTYQDFSTSSVSATIIIISIKT